MAGYEDPVGKPHDWDKAVAAAYLRMIGLSQVDAANGAGIGERTIVRWEQCSWWQDARDEASDRWLNDLVAESRATLMKSIKAGDPIRALQVLERRDQRLAPPAHQIEHHGPDGGPIPIQAVAHHYEDADADGE